MVGVGEMIASAVVKQISSRLIKVLKDEITLQWKFKDELCKMEGKMKDLEALMRDADDKVSRGGDVGAEVGRWLMKLKSVSHDVEDLLDDLDTHHHNQAKPDVFFSGNNKAYQMITRPRNLDALMKKIELIEIQGRKFNLRNEPPIAGSRTPRTPETFSIGNGLQGRGTEKDYLISLLFRTEASDISIVPIVGLGGIGKTTLAQSVLEDKRVNSFDIQVWVHVSDMFDLNKIGRAIISKCTGRNDLDARTTLEFISETLRVQLTGKKYLIVLDDLWEEDGNIIDELKRMLQYGSKGSRIIVTTRNQRVVERGLRTGGLSKTGKICVVPEADQINLGALLTNDCWELMKMRAFGPGDDQSSLEGIGKEIAGLCGGLPLVANAFGQVMSQDKNIEAWKDILKMIKLGLGVDDQKKTLESLKLSYYYMKPYYKMCFTYLAAFPKGFVIDTNRLIQQWNALGYTYPGYNGQTVLKYLLGMSFLQISGSLPVGSSSVHGKAPQEVTMHDFVHELVSIITAEEFLVMDATEPKNWEKYIHCRHAQLIKYKDQFPVFKHLPHKLRSLHFRNSQELQLPKNAFSKSKYIRILDISAPQNTSGCSIKLTSSMDELKLLRYFDATDFPIVSLPKSFHTLQNMESLILSNCSLETLPENIHSLYKLCYLDLSGNRSLNKLPTSLGKLAKLSSLNLLGCSILQELPESICELTCLVTLDMSECRAIQILPDKFGSLPNLLFLSLSGCSKLRKLPDSVSLKSLKHLILSNCHELEKLPQDFGNLVELQFLNLSDCYKISVLPKTFCKLTQLKDLNLSDCHDLKELPYHVGNLSKLESLNLTSCSKLQLLPDSLCKMLNLRDLNVSYCISLQKLPSSLGDLKLHMLDINCSMALGGLPDGLDTMSSLTQLECQQWSANDAVSEMAESIKENLKLPMRTVHIVQQTGSSSCSSIVELAQSTCRDLEVVKLQNVKDPEDAERAMLRDKSDLRLLSLKWGYIEEDIPVIGQEAFHSSFRHDQRPHGEEDKPVLERLIPSRTLETFILQGYLSPDFPSWMSDISSYLPSLTILGICGFRECDTLPPFGQLPNLRSLFLADSHKITRIGREFYGDGGTCTKLRVIELSSMKNLEEWWTTQSGTENEECLIPNLHSLTLTACPKLKFLPYPPRSMHWELHSSDESLPEGGFGELRSSVVPFRMGIFKCKFSPNKWHGLQHFPTLEVLTVGSCSNLRALLDVMQFLTSLSTLHLISLHELRALPECLGQLTSLKTIIIMDCPNLTSFPESMKKLAALKKLFLEGTGLQILQEWIGQLICLQELSIILCPGLASLPESIQHLTALEKLHIEGCPILAERCQREDAHKISHIPEVTLPEMTPEMFSKVYTMSQKRLWIEQASTYRDAGARTSGYTGASTSGYARASALFADLMARLLTELQLTSGHARASALFADYMARLLIELRSTYGDTGASYFFGILLAKLLIELQYTYGHDEASTLFADFMAKLLIELHSTYGDPGASALFPDFMTRLHIELHSIYGDVGASALFPDFMATLFTVLELTYEDAEESALFADLSAKLLIELHSTFGDNGAWTSGYAGASTSGDARASTSLYSGASPSFADFMSTLLTELQSTSGHARASTLFAHFMVRLLIELQSTYGDAGASALFLDFLAKILLELQSTYGDAGASVLFPLLMARLFIELHSIYEDAGASALFEDFMKKLLRELESTYGDVGASALYDTFLANLVIEFRSTNGGRRLRY